MAEPALWRLNLYKFEAVRCKTLPARPWKQTCSCHASAVLTILFVLLLQVRLTPPVSVDQQAVDPLCASPDQEQQVSFT